jgi:hypothetical protein
MAPGTLKAVLNLTREDHPLSNSCLQRHMCQKTLPIMSKVSSVRPEMSASISLSI